MSPFKTTVARVRAVALCLVVTLARTADAAGPVNAPAPAPTQLPTGGQVVAGQAQITQNAAAMTVQQGSLRAVIDWQQFNLGSQAQIRFDQPSADAVTLNRVIGADPSQIMGRISAPGQVFISNPQGVLFGAGASVDVGGLVATTMGIGTTDFMAGLSRFDRNGSTAGVVNLGRLTASPQGYIALLAPEVRNEGVITARAGTAVLAAGEAITLNFDTPGRLGSITVTPAQIATLVENKRAVLVEGGQIILSARSAEQLMGSVVNSGELNATSLVQRGGRILLEGDDITLAESSRIEARGATGGGSVSVGGDWQGSGSMHQARTVTMDAGASIDASATGRGDGGSVVLWSDTRDAASATTASGSIVARGGSDGGNGGRVETSGHTVEIGGLRVDAGASNGTGGLWLVDPSDSTITQSVANSYAATLNTGTDVLDDVTGSITWGSGVSLTKSAGGDATLTLRAGNSSNANISLSGATIGSTAGKLNLVLWSRYATTTNAGYVQINNSNITTNGGALWVGGGNATTWNGLTVGDGYAATYTADESALGISGSTINTGAGDIRMSGSSYVTSSNSGIRNWGLYLSSSSLTTTSGGINLSGDLQGRYNTGVGLWIGSSPVQGTAGAVNITSGSGAISLTGTGQDQAGSGSGYRHALMLITNQAGDSVTVRSGSGAITLSGNATFGAGGDFTSDTSGIQLQTGSTTAPVQVVSTSGAITLTGQNTQQASQYENALRFASSDAANNIRIGYDGSTAYSGNILIQGDSILQRTQQPGAGSIAVQTTGTVTIAPISTSFTALRADASSTLTFDNDWNFGSTLGGFTFGKAGNATDLSLSNALTTGGPISLYGGSVTLNADLATTLANAAILVKGSGNIVTNTGRTLQTNGGPITLWSDSDANGGYIFLNQNATLDSRTQTDRTAGTNTTGGGKITLAGGADNGSGAPGGYAQGDSGNTDRGGINFGDQTQNGHNNNTQILSGGGDVLLRGKSSNGMMGINWVDGGTLNAGGTGIVSFDGQNTNNGHGIEFGSFGVSGSSTTIRSGGGSSGTAAVTLSGSSGSSNTPNGVQARALTVLATGAGGISVTGTANNGGGVGYLGDTNFLAASGAISINGGSAGVSFRGGTLGKMAATAVTASTSNVSVSGGSFAASSATTIDTTGTVTLQPSGTSFTSAQTFPSSLSVASTASGLTFGKSGNTADLTLGNAETIAGPISLYGGNITLNADLTSTLATAPILLKASSSIVTNNTRTLQTNGGAITLWADSDNSGQGFILLNQNATLDSRTAADRTASTNTTGGGKITLAGGADDGTGAPAGYAISTSSTSDRGGINLGDQSVNGHNNNTQLLSGGGDVTMRGSSGTGTMGISWVDSGTVNAGSTGLIRINGVNTSTGHGIEFGAYAVSGSSIVLRSGGGTSSTPAISISGTGGSSGNGAQSTRLTGIATGAGGISISGTTANGSGFGYTGSTDFLAASGPIGIDGGARGISTSGGTIGKKAATAVTASSSNVTLTGGTINLGSGTTIDTTGTVTLQPSATSFTSAQTLGSNLTITGGVSGLTFGKPGNTADLTVNSAQSIAGPISLYGGSLYLNAPITETSSSDTTLLMQATGDIVNNGASITSSNARMNMVFIADWDSTNGGTIYVNGGTTPVTFNTHGGAAWLGGNGYGTAYGTTTWNGLTVGTGAATSFSTTTYGWEGVNLKAMTFTTSGGDVYVAGTNNRYNNGENRYGVILQQGTAVNTGSGNITLVGTLAQQTGTLSTYPVLFGAVVDTASLLTTTGNISITGGEAPTNGSFNAGGYGVRLYNSTVRTTGATGNITIAGTIGTNNGNGSTLDGVQLQAYGANAVTAVSTVGGNLSITGTANTVSAAASNGIELLTGQSSNTNSNNPVLQVVSRTGNVSLTGDNPANTNTGSTGVVLNSINYGKIAVGYDGTNAYSGATTVSGRSVVETNTYAGYLTLGGSGALTIQPTGNSFVRGAATGQSLDFNASWTLGSSHSAITLGKDAGTAAKTDTLTVSNALTAAGPISLYGGTLALTANLTSTLAGASLLAKASGDITAAASTTFQTNNGNITLWSDSDASGAGAIALGDSATFNSASGSTTQQTGGGKITLAGGADGNSDGIPDGFAISTSGQGIAFGTTNASSVALYSGGGDVLLKGKTSATSGVNSGVFANGALGIASGQGAIGINGESGASYGIEFSNSVFSGTGLTLNSAKTSGTAIAITGTTTRSGAYGIVFDYDGVENLLATGGGGIAISGTGGTGGYGVWLQNTNVLATSGAISIDGGTGGIRVASGPAGSKIGKSTSGVTSSSSNVTLSGDVLTVSAATTVDTTGTVTVQPSGASFAGTQTLPSNLTIASGATGLTFGKVGNTAGLSLPNAQAIAGPISLYGGDIGIASTLNATAAGNILIQASGTLTMGAGSRAQTADGNVVATAARWVNQSGATALVAGGTGRYWQVWSSNADPFNVTTGDTRGGLVFDYKQYGATYGSSAVLGTGNGLLYSYQPTVTASLTGTVSKVYDGGTAATLLAGNFNPLGNGVDGDQSLVLGAPSGSAFASKNVGSGLTVTANGLTVASALSSSATGSKAVYGYALTSSSASASIGTITQKALTATVAAPNKVYDGSTTASPTLSITSGLVGSETLGLSGSASFNSKDVATANLVTVTSATLSNGANGGLAGNYSLAAGQTVAASITPKALTATVAAPSKVYDGSTAATPTLTIASGLVGSETLGVAGTASFNTKDVATANLVTVASTTLANGANGGLAGNYSLAAGQTVASTITPKALTATVAAPSKAYDGTTFATPTLTIASGLVGGETVGAGGTASFNTKDVATANLVTVTATTLANGANGGLAGNYSLAAGQTVASTITRKALTATVAAPNKVYDGNVTATPTFGTVSGLVGSETLGVSGTASFNSKDVATANLVTVTGTTLANGTNGGLAGNYSLATGSSVAASITRKALTATVTAPDKVYDGGTGASPTLTIASGLVGSETVGVSGTANFNSKDVTTANLVTVASTALADGTNGGLAGNYSLTAGQTVAAAITRKALTAIVSAPSKVYDGTTAATPTLSIASGLVGGETLGASGTGSFNSKDVATANLLTVTATTLANGTNGGLASNYSLAAGQTVAAAITPKALSATVVAPGKVYDGSTAAAPTLTIASGLVGSETLGVSGTASFNSKDVASANLVTVTGTTLSNGANGGLAGNYSLAAGETVAAGITPKALTATVASSGKAYDGTTAATPTLTIASGLVGSETLVASGIASFNTKDVATANLVTVTATSLAGGTNGGLAGNYSLAAGQTVGSTITPRALTATVAAANKVYDGNASASPTLTVASGLVGSETLGVGGTASFNSKDVDTASLVTVGSTTLSDGANGGIATNYSLAPGATVAARITPKALTATVAAPTKVYDGTTVAAPTLTIASGLVGSETIGVGGVASFNSKDVATANLVTVTGTTLVDGGNGGRAVNYSLAAGGTVAAGITPKALTATVAAPSKVYDGTTTANPILDLASGLVGSETLGVAATASFNSKDVATANLVTVVSTALADGTNGGLAGNYSLAAGQTVASAIIPKALTAIVAAPGKVYDGTATATPTLTLTGGLVGNETVAVTGTAAFNSKNVATANTVTVTGTSLADGTNGGLAGNYVLATGQTVAAVITPLAINVTGVSANDKVYDAGTLTTLRGNAGAAVLQGDSATLTGPAVASFADKNVGTGKAVGVTGYTLVGSDAANYTLMQPAGLTAKIVPAALQITGLIVQDKVYDATTSVTLGGIATVAPLGADQLGLAGSANASFADRNVGSAKPIAVGGFTLTGADAANYLLAPTASVTASITPATLSLAGTRVYDGTTAIAGSQLGASGVAGETFVVTGSGAVGNLASRNVRAGQSLASVDGLALGAGSNGALAANYLPLARSTSRVDVTARPLTVGAAPVDKVYDGTTFADTGAAVIAGSLVAGDRLTGGQFAYADPNVGNAKVVATSQATVDDGNQGRNYSIAFAANQAVGRITPAPLTVTANDDAKFVTLADGANYNGVHYAGFVNGESAAVLGGVATITRLGSSEVPGFQSGVLAPSGLSAVNYDIRYANGSFTIVPAGQLLVRVANQSATYGDATAYGYAVLSAQYLDGNHVIQTLTPSTATGNIQHYSDRAGGQATFTLGPVAGTTSGAGLLNAGSYVVGATNVTETSANFSNTLTVVGQLTVDPRALRPVLGSGASKVYDGTTAMSSLQIGLSGAVAGDQLQTNGIGNFDSRNAGTRLDYTVDRLTLGGADAGNYVLLGSGGFRGSDGVITPKPVTLTAPTIGKVYDGQTGYAASAADLAALGAQLGVTGDVVRSIQLVFADKNVGTGKGVTMSGVVVDDGNGGANYVLTPVGNSSGTITRLGSVTWTGGTTGNWFDPANWAGGAVPDLSNVAQVVIPTGVRVAFDDAVVPTIARGPVFVDGIGSAGSLQVRGGELNVGPGGVRLADLSQSGGNLTVQGDALLQTFAQTGGASTVAGNFTATQGYTQGAQGSVAVQGRVDITAPLGDVALGTLRAVGGLEVTTTGGAIRQAPGTALTVSGATVLDAGRGDIALGNAGNDFIGAVSARGNEVTLRDANALTLGTVVTLGDLHLSSNDRLDLGHTTVGGSLAASSQGGDIVQQGPLTVLGTVVLDAGSGAVRLTDPANAFVDADASPVASTPSSDVTAGPAWTLPILPTPFLPPTPTATLALDRAMELELHVATVWLDPASQRLVYPLPTEIVDRVRRSGATPVMGQDDGRPLPAWLRFDADTMSLSANEMPDGRLPMTLALWIDGERLLIRVAAAPPASTVASADR